MAFGKVFRLIMGNGSGEGPSDDAIDLTGLRVSFRILRSNIFSNNRAEISVYNPTPEIMARFMQADSSDLTIEAGYEDDGSGLLYAGHVLDCHPEWDGPTMKAVIMATPIRATGFTDKDNQGIGAVNPYRNQLEAELNRQNNILENAQALKQPNGLSKEDAKTFREAKAAKIANAKGQITVLKSQIESSDKAAANSVTAAQLMTYVIGRETKRINANTYLNIAFAPGTPIRDVVEAVATATGYPVTGADQLDWKLSNGYNASYSLKSVFRDIERMLWSKGFAMYVDLKEWAIYNAVTRKLEQTVAFLSGATGLLGVSPAKVYEYDKERPEVLPPARTYELRTILNYRIRPNSVVDIDSSDLLGSTQLKGLYLVETVEWIGDTAGGGFDGTILVSEYGGT